MPDRSFTPRLDVVPFYLDNVKEAVPGASWDAEGRAEIPLGWARLQRWRVASFWGCPSIGLQVGRSDPGIPLSRKADVVSGTESRYRIHTDRGGFALQCFVIIPK